jgi:hypothetical protein
MDDQMTEQLVATADRLATAAEALDRVLKKLDAQQEALNAKVDRIVAAVEEQVAEIVNSETQQSRRLQDRVTELERSNEELKAQATRTARKTLPPLVSALLNKGRNEAGDKLGPRHWTRLFRL